MSAGACCRHCEQVDEMFSQHVEMRADVKMLLSATERIEAGMVHRREIGPIKAIAFGLVGAICLAFVAGLTALLWNATPR